MVAFASPDDLASRLNRTFTGAEEEWVSVLLEDASAFLREAIGQQVYPGQQTTYTGYPSAGREDLPQWPIVSVDAVERDGVAVDYDYRPGYILVSCDDPVDVTFTWGYSTVPRELVGLACVLVSQALIPLEAQLGLSVGGLSSVALDDFKLAWADGGEGSGMTLTKHAEASIVKQFGQGGITVVETG